MRTWMMLVVMATMTWTGMGGCGAGESRYDLCGLCLSESGPCRAGCANDEPVALCEAYLGALCEAETRCRGSRSTLCGLDCTLMNDCEVFAVAAFPVELQACIESIPDAACGSEGLEGPTAACERWLGLAEEALEDSCCSTEGEGSSGSGGR